MNGGKAGSNIEVKKINRNQTFRYICKYEKVSKPDICCGLGISMPTVIQNVAELMDNGLICEIGAFESTGGRKAKVIAPVLSARYAIGIDITQYHVGLVLTDLSGKVLKHTRQYKPFINEKKYFKEMGEMAVMFLEDSNIPRNHFLGFGISVPGIVMPENEKFILSYALKITNTPCRIFSQFIPYPCIFTNDANAAGIAEMFNVENRFNAVYLSLSNSVGGTIILDRSNSIDGNQMSENIFSGDNYRDGEFGHMTLKPGGKDCYCGKKGCVDAYCSVNNLSILTNGKLEIFFEELERGNNKFEKIWEEYLSNLAIVVNNLRMAFDCSVIIGGYVGSYIEPYITDLQDKAADLNAFEKNSLYIKPCRFMIEASALGAALQHIEIFINSI